MIGHNEIVCLATPSNLSKLLTFLDDSCTPAGLTENVAFAGHLANAQWVEAERLAHTLKGLVGTLGANNVAISAGTLEKASKSRQADAAETALSALTPLLTALQQHLADKQAAAEPAAVSGDVQPGKLPDCLQQLRQLLNEGDSDAIDLLEKTTSNLSKRYRRKSCNASARPCKILNSMPHKFCWPNCSQRCQPLRPRNPNRIDN